MMVWLLVSVIVSTQGVGKFGAESSVRMGLDVFNSLEECVRVGDTILWKSFDYVCIPVSSEAAIALKPQVKEH